MRYIVSIFRDVVRDRRGITAMEYGLIAALITTGIVGILVTLGPKLRTAFSNLNNALP